MTTKLIVLQAAPSVRTMCPVSYVEGEWREVPDHAKEAAFMVPRPIALEAGDRAFPDDVSEELTLVARPCGRMMRRSSDGTTAPVWEVRRPSDWPGSADS